MLKFLKLLSGVVNFGFFFFFLVLSILGVHFLYQCYIGCAICALFYQCSEIGLKSLKSGFLNLDISVLQVMHAQTIKSGFVTLKIGCATIRYGLKKKSGFVNPWFFYQCSCLKSSDKFHPTYGKSNVFHEIIRHKCYNKSCMKFKKKFVK